MEAIIKTPVFHKALELVKSVYAKLDLLAPVSNLMIRLWIANVFFSAGLLKFQSWDTTMYLFEYEYAVPLLSPEIAAVMGTAVELCFPVLLALGLMGRFAAFVLYLLPCTLL